VSANELNTAPLPGMEPAEPRLSRGAAKRVSDPELIAMAEVTDIVAQLPEPARRRVMQWVHDRYVADQETF